MPALPCSSGHGDCLLDEPTAVQYNPKLKMPVKLKTQPGQVYDKDVQCDQVFGKGSTICPFMVRLVSVTLSTSLVKLYKLFNCLQGFISFGSRASLYSHLSNTATSQLRSS